MERKTKIYGLITGIIMFIVLLTGLTYAYITWQSTNTNMKINSECFTINYVKGQNINNSKLYVINEDDFLNGNQITIIEGMELTTISLEIDEECAIDGIGKIILTTNTLSTAFISGNSVGALKYKLVEYSSSTYPNVTATALSGETFTVLAEGEITATGSTDVYSMELLSGNKKEYIIIFYLDEVLAQNDVAAASFYGTISAEVTQKH